MRLSFWAGLFGVLVGSGTLAFRPAHADIILFQSSDNHSEYSAVPNYVKSTSKLAQQYLAAQPGSLVVHLVNGDLAGPSSWTDFDHGALNYELFARLAMHDKVILNLGNHEAFDYGGEKGHGLFRRQVEAFIAVTGTKLTTSNLDLHPEAHDLFSSHHDLITANGTRVRVVGMVLEDYFNVSKYNFDVPTQIMKRVLPLLEQAKQELSRAAADGVQVVLFQCHEAFVPMKMFVAELHKWKASRPELASLEIPVVFAAHDHEVRRGIVEGTHVVDSGTNFEYSKVVLDDFGRVKEIEHFNHGRQAELAEGHKALRPQERVALKKVRRVLRKVEAINAKSIAEGFEGVAETRSNLKRARSLLGLRLADALVGWAREAVRANGTPNIEGYVSFFNSGSYRGAQPFEPGEITVGTIKRMFPLPGKPRAIVLSGAQVQRMYLDVRLKGEGAYLFTPQLPSHVRATSQHELLLRGSDGHWSPLKPDGRYVVALDAWLGENGPRHQGPEWDFARLEHVELPHAELMEVMMKHLPRELLSPRPVDCELLLMQP